MVKNLYPFSDPKVQKHTSPPVEEGADFRICPDKALFLLHHPWKLPVNTHPAQTWTGGQCFVHHHLRDIFSHPGKIKQLTTNFELVHVLEILVQLSYFGVASVNPMLAISRLIRGLGNLVQ